MKKTVIFWIILAAITIFIITSNLNCQKGSLGLDIPNPTGRRFFYDGIK